MLGKDKLKKVAIISTGVAIYEYIPGSRPIVDSVVEEVLKVIEHSSIVQKVEELEKSYGLTSLLIILILAAVADKISASLKEYRQEKNFLNKKYNNFINVSVSYFQDSKYKIKNEVKGHIEEMITRNPEIIKHIKAAAKKTNAKQIVLPFKEQVGWDLYENIRDADHFFAGRNNATLEAAKVIAGKKTQTVTFVGAFIKEPQFTVTEERKIKQLESPQDIPHTKAEIRLPLFPLQDIEETILWCEKRSQEEGLSFDITINKMCIDKASCCECVDDFIKYMMSEKEEYEDIQVNRLFKWPTYRRRFISMAHVAREHSNKKPVLYYPLEV